MGIPGISKIIIKQICGETDVDVLSASGREDPKTPKVSKVKLSFVINC